MSEGIVIPPIVSQTVTAALTHRHAQGGLAGVTRTAALTAVELAQAPITSSEVVRRVADWHTRHPDHTTPDGRSTPLAGIWGGRAGRDWALEMAGRMAAVAPEKATGPVASGLAIVAQETGRVLLLQRCLDDKDPASGRWEFPGGKIDEGEGAYEAAQREFAEEVGVPAPGKLAGDWMSPNGVYHGFIHVVPTEGDVICNADHEDRHVLNPDDPDGDGIEVVAWWSVDDARDNPVMRDEMSTSPWDDLRVKADAKVAALPATSTCDYCSKPATKALLHAEGMAYVPVCDAHEAKGKAEIGASELSGTRPFTGAIDDPLPIIREIPPSKKRAKLKRLSKRLNTIDRDLRSKLAAGAEVAMADGLRRAGVKVTQRAQKRSKAVQASVGACSGHFPPAVLAAAGITEQEALAYSFDAFGEKADRWITTANKAKRRAFVDELEYDEESLIAAEGRWDAAKGVAVGFLLSSLTALAIDRLTGDPVVDTQGEQAEGDVPLSIIGASMAMADGRPLSGPGSDGPGEMGEGEMTVDRLGGGVVYDLIVQGEPEAVAYFTFDGGGSARPFEPHESIEGTTATVETMHDLWGKDPGEWPEGDDLWLPMDHKGCEHFLSESWDVPEAGEASDASAA